MSKKNNIKLKSIWAKIVHHCKSHWTTPFKLMLCYILFIIIGSCLLYLPISLEHGYHRFTPVEGTGIVGEYEYNELYPNLTFWDSMFIITSAFTNTGLSVTDIDYTYTFFGEFVIYVWIQLGGFGLLSFFYLLGKGINKLSEKSRWNTKIINPSFVGLVERSGTKISNSGKILFSIFFINLVIQIFFSFIISFILYAHPFHDVWVTDSTSLSATEQSQYIDTYQNYGLAFWKSLFLVGSTINNAGLDLFGSYSIAIFRNDLGILIQVFLILIFVFGGIGYTCVYDVYNKTKEVFWKIVTHISNKHGGKDYSYKIVPCTYSILTKVCLWMTLIMAISSIALTYSVEYIAWVVKISSQTNSDSIKSLLDVSSRNDLFNGSIFNQNFYLIFLAMSTRSAGFSTIDVNYLQDATKWLFIFLMFIGTSPASTGGGIRTTTLAVAFKTIFAKTRSLDDPTLFKRRITKRKSIESFQIFSIAISLIFVASMLILTFESEVLNNSTYAKFISTNVIFEISSAFGTTGLSGGVTSYLNWFSMFLVMIVMFIGQLGVTNTLTTFSSKYDKIKVNKYPDLELIVG